MEARGARSRLVKVGEHFPARSMTRVPARAPSATCAAGGCFYGSVAGALLVEKQRQRATVAATGICCRGGDDGRATREDEALGKAAWG